MPFAYSIMGEKTPAIHRVTHESGIKTTFLLYSTLLNDIMAG
jgi:hypothetical protein